MHISNHFVIVIACNIQIVIRMLYHSFEIILLFIFVLKSDKYLLKLDLVSKKPFSFYFIEISKPPDTNWRTGIME